MYVQIETARVEDGDGSGERAKCWVRTTGCGEFRRFDGCMDARQEINGHLIFQDIEIVGLFFGLLFFMICYQMLGGGFSIVYFI